MEREKRLHLSKSQRIYLLKRVFFPPTINWILQGKKNLLFQIRSLGFFFSLFLLGVMQRLQVLTAVGGTID